MNKYKRLLIFIAVLILQIILVGNLASDNPVYATHNINHCAEVVGSDNSVEFEACVSATPDTISEQQAWCEANKSDSDFESCMLNEFDTNVSITANGEPEVQKPSLNNEPIQTDCEPKPPGTALSKENCGIVNLIVIGINFLSAVAGMAIIASIMIAGYQYMTAQDNAGQIQKAKQRIIWALTALLLFIFMYALLNFLVPGGVL